MRSTLVGTVGLTAVELGGDAPRRAEADEAGRAAVKPKNQRLVLLVLALVAVRGAVLLAMSAMRDQAAFFYAPADVAAQGPAARPGGADRRHGAGRARSAATPTA